MVPLACSALPTAARCARVGTVTIWPQDMLGDVEEIGDNLLSIRLAADERHPTGGWVCPAFDSEAGERHSPAMYFCFYGVSVPGHTVNQALLMVRKSHL